MGLDSPTDQNVLDGSALQPQYPSTICVAGLICLESIVPNLLVIMVRSATKQRPEGRGMKVGFKHERAILPLLCRGPNVETLLGCWQRCFR